MHTRNASGAAVVVVVCATIAAAAAAATAQRQTWSAFQRDVYAGCLGGMAAPPGGVPMPPQLAVNECVCLADATVGREQALTLAVMAVGAERAMAPDVERCTARELARYAQEHPRAFARYAAAVRAARGGRGNGRQPF